MSFEIDMLRFTKKPNNIFLYIHVKILKFISYNYPKIKKRAWSQLHALPKSNQSWVSLLLI